MNNETLNGKLIVLYPVTQGVGGKYVATNVAHLYKEENPDKKVALVDFDFKAPFLAGYLSDQDKVHGIDNLIEKIDGKFLNEELFMENMVRLKNGVDLLKGTNLGNHHYFIQPSHIDEIIGFLRKLYDVVFVSVSTHPDNSATTSALFVADDVVVVSRNDFTCHSMVNGALKVVNHYKNDDIKLKWVYNQYQEDSKMDFNDVIRDNDLQVIGVIPYNAETIDNRDLQGSVLGKFMKRKRQESPFGEVVTGLEM
ncbi:AAA family ATPase [Rossellomorea marisflavi]|uniref:AAA family ATPase n=1 Tax=Rossellomorea marisflavi TaxID=189381 RepID=UPI003FA0D875